MSQLLRRRNRPMKTPMPLRAATATMKSQPVTRPNRSATIPCITYNERNPRTSPVNAHDSTSIRSTQKCAVNFVFRWMISVRM